jgi:hypothetical protein
MVKNVCPHSINFLRFSQETLNAALSSINFLVLKWTLDNGHLSVTQALNCYPYLKI